MNGLAVTPFGEAQFLLFPPILIRSTEYSVQFNTGLSVSAVLLAGYCIESSSTQPSLYEVLCSCKNGLYSCSQKPAPTSLQDAFLPTETPWLPTTCNCPTETLDYHERAYSDPSSFQFLTASTKFRLGRAQPNAAMQRTPDDPT